MIFGCLPELPAKPQAPSVKHQLAEGAQWRMRIAAKSDLPGQEPFPVTALAYG